MSIVIKINTNLLATVYPISSQYWSAASCHPDSGQSITIDFILFYYALSFLMHINSTMLAIMNFVMSNNWTTVCPNLNSC